MKIMGSRPDRLKNFRITTRTMRAASFLLGAGVLVWLVLTTDVRSIVTDLSRVWVGLPVILALEFALDALNSLGWWYTLPVAERAGTYPRLFWVRSAGNALNESTPTASLGGELAKIMLLRGRISIPAATASLFSTKVAYCLADTIFILAGEAAVWSRLTLPPEIDWALLSGMTLMLVGITLFAVLQMRGIGAGTVKVLRGLRVPGRWLKKAEPFSKEIDAHLSDFYRHRRGDLLRAVGAHLCAFCCGAFQMLLILQWLRLGFDPGAALGIAAFSALFALVGFAVPASLGIMEGGTVLIFWALGLPRAPALAAGIVLRLNWLVKTVVGLVAFMLLQHTPAAGDR